MLFVDWVLNTEVLEQLWEGDSAPPLPTVRLFAAAAAAADHRGYWDAEMDEDESETDEDHESEGMWYSASLELHLSDELIEQVRDRLGSRRTADC